MVTSASSAFDATAERPARRGEHDPAHPVARRAVGVLRAQALVDGAVLAVDRAPARPRPAAPAPAARPGRRRSATPCSPSASRLPALERGQRDAEPGEPDDAVDAHVADGGDRRPARRARRRPRCPPGTRACELGGQRVVGDGDDRRAPPLRLLGELRRPTTPRRARRPRTAPARPRSPRAPAPRSTPSTPRSTTDVVTRARLPTRAVGSTRGGPPAPRRRRAAAREGWLRHPRTSRRAQRGAARGTSSPRSRLRRRSP